MPAAKFVSAAVADVSSSHITEGDADKRNDMGQSRHCELAVAPFDVGWFVQVSLGQNTPDDNTLVLEQYEEREFSPEFVALVAAAQAQGIHHLRIHADGPAVDGVPTFDW